MPKNLIQALQWLKPSPAAATESKPIRTGRYEMIALIGKGGMGRVFKARDTLLDRIVALKVSKNQYDKGLKREVRALAALNHPNICTIYDVGSNYLVMEYIEGSPLRGPYPVEEALHHALQICDALVAAHAKGITHRDLEPIRGTPCYMSPEQAQGQPVDARSDIFSFGSLLYEMLTGRRAFHGPI